MLSSTTTRDADVSRIRAFVEKRDEFIKVYPELADVFKHACRSCATSKALGMVLRLGPRPGIPIPFEDLKAIRPKTSVALPRDPAAPPISALAASARQDHLFRYDDGSIRTGCVNCAMKHVAQALILMKEVPQGYPDHVEVARWHLKEAARVTGFEEAGKVVLDPVRPRDGIEALIDLFSKKTGKDARRWLAIGHMAEAADEILEIDAAAAMAIRTERLRMMESATHQPPFVFLLGIIDSIQEEYDAESGHRADSSSTSSD
jgi:hypothetical protein